MMKKLVIVVILALISSIFFFIPKTDALTNYADTRLELETFLIEKIKSHENEFEIVYRNHEVIDFTAENVCSNLILDAFKQTQYEANNRKEILCSKAKVEEGYLIKYKVSYRTTKEEEYIIDQYVSKEAERMLSITTNKQELVGLINKTVGQKITYSFNGASIYTAYGAVYDGNAICHAYTLLATKFLDKLNIENKIVIGYLTRDNVKHSWNLVSIDGSWYHLDITFNDTIKPILGTVDYFTLKGDSTLKPTRTWEYDKYPKAYSDLNYKVAEKVNIIEEIIYVEEDIPQTEEVIIPRTEQIIVPKVEQVIIPPSPIIVPTPPTVVSPSGSVDINESYTSLATRNNLIPSFALNYPAYEVITREQFASYIVKLYEKKYGTIYVSSNKSFLDSNNTDVLKAKEVGLVHGSNGYYNPYYPTTRQDAALIISNFANLVGIYNNRTTYISDISSVPSWATSQVYYAVSNNFISLNNNKFEPLNYIRKSEVDEIIYKLYIK